MKETSPSTTTSNNRGGRPKDWTEERARKLIRLYVYTDLSVQKIIKALADHTWAPKYVGLQFFICFLEANVDYSS